MRKDKINPAHIHLRAASNDDLDFIFRLRLLTMKKYIEKACGWKEKEQREYAAELM